jgi:hypothetical protein
MERPRVALAARCLLRLRHLRELAGVAAWVSTSLEQYEGRRASARADDAAVSIRAVPSTIIHNCLLARKVILRS